MDWQGLQAKYNIPSYDAITEGWFSVRKIMSYNRHMCMITGKRSSGKSTGVALWLLIEYLRAGKGWIYTRRTKDEMDQTAPSWFDNAVNIINGYISNPADRIAVTYKSGDYYVNNVFAGKAIPLSTQSKSKSTNLSWCMYIVYDEFIAFDGSGYIGGCSNPMREYRSLLSLYQTADRGIGKAYRNETIMIALGNNDSFFNPLYMALGVDKYIRTDTHFLAPKGEEWVVMQMRAEDADAAEKYRESVGYKLADRHTKDVAYENISIQSAQSDVFIGKPECKTRDLCNLHWDGYDMSVKIDYKGGYIYICHGCVNGLTDYALTMGDHRPNYVLAMRVGGSGYLAMIKNFYMIGAVFFENKKCKYCLDNFLKFMI